MFLKRVQGNVFTIVATTNKLIGPHGQISHALFEANQWPSKCSYENKVKFRFRPISEDNDTLMTTTLSHSLSRRLTHFLTFRSSEITDLRMTLIFESAAPSVVQTWWYHLVLAPHHRRYCSYVIQRRDGHSLEPSSCELNVLLHEMIISYQFIIHQMSAAWISLANPRDIKGQMILQFKSWN